jgi:hypothetical protein
MFFNKLKQEMRKEFSEKMTIIFAKLSEDITNGILAGNKSTEELIKKYEHTQWKNLEPFEKNVLVDRYNLEELYGGLGLYCGDKTVFFSNNYVSETIKTAYEKELKKQEAFLTKKVKQENKLSSLSNPITDKNAVTLEQIETVLKTQKSSPKAIKAIKELIKIRYEE